MRVDAVYGLDYATLRGQPEAWSATYQNPSYPSIFAAGIAFAPPGPISEPHITKNGTAISAAPPRTGMIAGVISRITAFNIADLVTSRTMHYRERMTEMFAACVASMGDSLWDGEAATIFIRVLIHRSVVTDLKYVPAKAEASQCLSAREPSVQICRFDSVARPPGSPVLCVRFGGARP